MNLSRATLEKLNKNELIDIIEQLQGSSDIALKFKKVFTDQGIYNGKTKFIFEVKLIADILYVSWKKLTPSGYGDNGIQGTFNIKLSKKQINDIQKNGFTQKIVLPIIKLDCDKVVAGVYRSGSSELMFA